MVVAVAARIRDTGEVVVGKPGKDRHDRLFFDNASKLTAGAFEFGFVDEKGNFLTRKEAWHHAFLCGQVDNEKDETLKTLISEDLW